jgi:hypothetical protein
MQEELLSRKQKKHLLAGQQRFMQWVGNAVVNGN